MNSCRRPKVVRLSIGAATLLVKLYPARTRRRFGDDLIEVTAELVQDAFARAGNRAVIYLWPRLLVDFAAALTSEYRDVWYDSKFDPERFSSACLLTASAVWILIVAASALDQRWAASALNASLSISTLLAFGLPVVALLACRFRPAAHQCRIQKVTPLLRASAAATIGSWSLLAFHIAQYA